jgi:hypothetical protein
VLTPEFDTLPQPLKWQQKILWGVSTGALCIYVGVSYYWQHTAPDAVPRLPVILHQLFPIVSAVLALSSLAYWRNTSADSALQQCLSHPSGSDTLIAALGVRYKAWEAAERKWWC